MRKTTSKLIIVFSIIFLCLPFIIVATDTIPEEANEEANEGNNSSESNENDINNEATKENPEQQSSSSNNESEEEKKSNETLTKSISELLNDIGITPDLQNILLTIIVIVIINVLRIIFIKIAHKNIKSDVKKFYKTRKIATYVSVVTGVIIVGFIWVEEFGTVITFLGIVSAGLAIALRDLVTNIVGWIFIIWRKPFRVGERIQIDNIAGDVIDTRVFQFSVMEIGNWVQADQSTGRIVHIPNSKVFTSQLANYVRGFNLIWNEIPVTVTFESNWLKAKDILMKIIRKRAEHLSSKAEQKIKEAAKQYMIFYNKLTPIVYTRVIDIGVTLTIRYLCEPQRRRTSENNIWEEILIEFSKTNDVTFAYPTQRFFNNPVEGKIKESKAEEVISYNKNKKSLSKSDLDENEK
ncbi:MAG: mechanosensitive ion channel family protein [Spirochaetota bacterium]